MSKWRRAGGVWRKTIGMRVCGGETRWVCVSSNRASERIIFPVISVCAVGAAPCWGNGQEKMRWCERIFSAAETNCLWFMSLLSGWNLFIAREKERKGRVGTGSAQRSALSSLWKYRKQIAERRKARQQVKVSFAVLRVCAFVCMRWGGGGSLFRGHHCASGLTPWWNDTRKEDDGHFGTGVLLRDPPRFQQARCWPSPQDGDQSFVLKWQENPPLDWNKSERWCAQRFLGDWRAYSSRSR